MASPAELGFAVLQGIIRIHDETAAYRDPYRQHIHFLPVQNLTADIISGFSDDVSTRQAAAEAITWLFSHDLIAEVHLPGANPAGTIVATRLGRGIAPSQNVAAITSAIRVIDLFPHTTRASLLVNLASNDFDTAIALAYKHVEVRMRERAELGSNDFGGRLVKKFFARVEATALQRVDRKGDLADEEHLFLGLFGLYRDRAVHEAPHIDSIEYALEVILGASHLLRIVESSQMKDHGGQSPAST